MTEAGTTSTATIIPSTLSSTRTGYKWELLLLLWLAFFLNQADRQLFSVVLPLIKKELLLTDAQLGLIASALVWTYGLLVPLAGFMGDRYSRKTIICASLFGWSVATVCSGMCSTLLQFVILRGLATGGGESFYAPSANALLSEVHHRQRSLALSIHQTAVYAGIIVSGLIAGYIAERYGWRSAFYLFGAFGIVVAAIIYFRLQRDTPAPVTQQPSIATTIRIVTGKPTAILLTLAFACMVFVNVAYLTWMPSFLVEKFSLSLTNAGFSSMVYHHVGAFLGVIAGGILADRLSKYNRRYRLLVQSVAMLLATPFIYGMGAGETTSSVYLSLFLFGFFRGIYDSNIFASLYEVIQPALRSSASGLMLMCAFMVGAFSPYLLGILKPSFGLSASLSALWVCYLLGSIFIGTAMLFYFNKDKE